MKLEFSGRIFEKYSNFKFNKNPSTGRGGGRVVPCGETDIYRSLTFREPCIVIYSYNKTKNMQ